MIGRNFIVLTSMTMFTPNQNPSKFVVRQKSKSKSSQICHIKMHLTLRLTKIVRNLTDFGFE